MSYLKKMDFMLTCGVNSSRTTVPTVTVPTVTVVTMVTTAMVSKQIKRKNRLQMRNEV